MRLKQKIVSFFVVATFVLSVVSFTPTKFYAVNAQSSAVLTGVINDRGVDTDSDGQFNYLEVAVEINVTESGYYSVEVDWLEEASPSNKTLQFWIGQSGYLEPGARFLNLSFYGATIYLAHFNPAFLYRLSLREDLENRTITDEEFHVPLSRVYSYSEFEQLARLTGVITDHGVDSDYDGLFDFLEVDVQVQAFESGWYYVQVYALQDSINSTFPVSISNGYYFDAGTTLNVTLSFYGPLINKAHFNPVFLSNLRLLQSWNTTIEERFHVPLSRQYDFLEFDSRALLTGQISDRGVDTNGDGLFNYIEIGVEVNATDASRYSVYVQLNTTVWPYIENYTWVELPLGLHTVNVSLNGAMIHASKVNFSSVYIIRLSDWHSGLDYRYFVPLSKMYSYTEFDAPVYFTGVVIDKGVDTDGDSKFEYLEIGVQINVTQAGYYDLSANGLLENSSWGHYPSDYKSGNFEVGLHFVNFTFPSQLIYSYKMNPTYVDYIRISGIVGYYQITLDQLNQVPLSRTYNYYEFDPHALLTGNVDDRGVDTDNDGLFDYLETSIEVNVTEVGRYTVQVSGLAEAGGINGTGQIYDYQRAGPFQLDLGVHLFNFTFYGPQIAYYEVNPRNITNVYLEEAWDAYNPWGLTIGYLPSAALTQQYYHSDFNRPLNDMQFAFTVYPDGSVAIDAMLNNTHMYPRNVYGPVANASASFSKVDNSILGSVNGSVGLPPSVTVPWQYPYYYAQFPTNMTTADFLSEYNNGILNAQLNASTVFPPIVKTQYPYNTTDFMFSGTFADGMVHGRLNGSSIMPSFIATQFPFNATDMTTLANFANNEFKGNVTLHLVSGLPAADIRIDFAGNRTAMLFNGYVDVVYGTYMGVVINATTVSKMISDLNSTIPGTGPNSLYDATHGILECTRIQTRNTTILNGIRIDYNVTVRGDFGRLIAEYIAQAFSYSPTPQQIQFVYSAVNATLSSVDNLSLILVYLHTQQLAQLDLSFDGNAKTLWSNAIQLITPTIPPDVLPYVKDQINAILKLGNATAYAAQNAWLYASYKTTPQPKLDLRMGLTANITQLKNDTLNVIPDLAYPAEVKNVIKSYLNKTYATLDSCNTTIHLDNGVADFRTDFTFEGDFKTQLNAAKSCYLSIMNITYPYQYNWQMKLLNRTLVDISDLRIDVRIGRDYVFVGLKTLLLFLEKQVIDNSRFKLWSLFNATTTYYDPPYRYEKLKIVIQGGSDLTHTVLPFLPPTYPTVPAPNSVSLDGKTFMWENTTISSLKELIFQTAYQGSYEYEGATYYVPVFSNSTAGNFNFDRFKKTISFDVDGASGTAGFCNITIPRSLLDVTMVSEWAIKKDGIVLPQEEYTITNNTDYTFIYITYTHSSHTISVIGTIAVREMPPDMIILTTVLTCLVAIVLAVIQRKRIRSFKTKSLDIAHRMASKFLRHSSNAD